MIGKAEITIRGKNPRLASSHSTGRRHRVHEERAFESHAVQTRPPTRNIGEPHRQGRRQAHDRLPLSDQGTGTARPASRMSAARAENLKNPSP